MEIEGKNLAHFMELPDRDIFAKTKPFLEFMDALAAREQHHWHRILSSPSEAHIRILDRYTGRERQMINLASNNYLGLTTHPRVVEAGLAAYREYGARGQRAAARRDHDPPPRPRT